MKHIAVIVIIFAAVASVHGGLRVEASDDVAIYPPHACISGRVEDAGEAYCTQAQALFSQMHNPTWQMPKKLELLSLIKKLMLSHDDLATWNFYIISFCQGLIDNGGSSNVPALLERAKFDRGPLSLVEQNERLTVESIDYRLAPAGRGNGAVTLLSRLQSAAETAGGDFNIAQLHMLAARNLAMALAIEGRAKETLDGLSICQASAESTESPLFASTCYAGFLRSKQIPEGLKAQIAAKLYAYACNQGDTNYCRSVEFQVRPYLKQG